MPDNKFPQYGEDAERMYVHEGKTGKEIAELLPISEKQIGKWVADGEWKQKKKVARQQIHSDEAVVKGLMRKYLKELDNKAIGQITPADLDMLAKLSSTLRTIQSMLDPKAATVFVMKKFLEFVAKKDKNLFQGLQGIAPEFFEFMERQ